MCGPKYPVQGVRSPQWDKVGGNPFPTVDVASYTAPKVANYTAQPAPVAGETPSRANPLGDQLPALFPGGSMKNGRFAQAAPAEPKKTVGGVFSNAGQYQTMY